MDDARTSTGGQDPSTTETEMGEARMNPQRPASLPHLAPAHQHNEATLTKDRDIYGGHVTKHSYGAVECAEHNYQPGAGAGSASQGGG